MISRILTWDWREQPDLDALGEAIRTLSGGAADLRAVPDTGSDQYAVVVADHPLSGDQAQAVWDDAGAGGDYQPVALEDLHALPKTVTG